MNPLRVVEDRFQLAREADLRRSLMGWRAHHLPAGNYHCPHCWDLACWDAGPDVPEVGRALAARAVFRCKIYGEG